MRFLIVHNLLPPQTLAEGICTSNFIEALASHGHQVIVLTASPRSDTKNIRYVTVPGNFTRKERYLERGQRLLHRFPEAGWNWSRAVARQASRILQMGEADVLYTRAMPFINHIAGYYTICPSHIPWIAHFSDPWPDIGLFGASHGKYGWRQEWHQKVVRRTDALTFTCHRSAVYCEELRGEVCCPQTGISHIMPHIMPHQRVIDSLSENSATSVKEKRYVLLHCGAFYGARTPDKLLAGWVLFLKNNPVWRDKVVLRQLGPPSPRMEELARDAGIEETIEQPGMCGYVESLQKIKIASALLLVESPQTRSSMYLPTKFIDYVWSQKPILALTPRDSTVMDFLGTSYPLQADPWDEEAIYRGFERLMHYIEEQNADSDGNESRSIREQVKQALEVTRPCFDATQVIENFVNMTRHVMDDVALRQSGRTKFPPLESS